MFFFSFSLPFPLFPSCPPYKHQWIFLKSYRSSGLRGREKARAKHLRESPGSTSLRRDCLIHSPSTSYISHQRGGEEGNLTTLHPSLLVSSFRPPHPTPHPPPPPPPLPSSLCLPARPPQTHGSAARPLPLLLQLDFQPAPTQAPWPSLLTSHIHNTGTLIEKKVKQPAKCLVH